ncbi:tyrosine-type recombinase/integrase [Rhizobium leguminosarum bv. viciae]|uniref:tyrosine-type recombinase/integrase n=1 Tax=Rhizobium ruizarguesonis TaxID=2081791 RepID=UPI00143FAF6F|nr:tyrosine-type recombinase/integrase [Rhizobium ruizarguesonis]NKJ72853.1 tyrosine-type recombinase/integrase [Rhizobium leguminosarum bv. viciae]NKQ80534.1 hypothetical protein [Rhizobium ruizarguesonis]
MIQAEQSEFQPLWFAFAKVERQDSAPYNSASIVTPISNYGADEWEFPENWLPPGSFRRNKLKFSDWTLRSNEPQLVRGTDDELIEQLKQFAYCLIFHRHHLTGKRKKKFNARPRTIGSEFLAMRRFFVELKNANIDTLKWLDDIIVEKCLQKMQATPERHNVLIDYIECLLAFCQLGLIENGPKRRSIVLKPKLIAKDSSKSRGTQPLTEEQTAEVISRALFYLENGNELCDLIALFKRISRRHQKRVIAQASIKYPTLRNGKRHNFVSKISKLIQTSAFHITGLHLAPRISEFLSQQRSSVGLHQGRSVMFCDRVTLMMTTVKSAETLYGHSRYFPVHPYMQHVHAVLIRLKDLTAPDSEWLFTSPSGRPWGTSHFNHMLRQFCLDHGFTRVFSSHTWRKTVVAITTLSTSNSLEALRELLGHAGVAEAVSYALSSPFVKAELDRANRKLANDYLEEILGDSLTLGGRGLGGPQGKTLEENLKVRSVNNKGKDDKKQIIKEVVVQSQTLSIAALKVGDGIDCFKQLNRRGACSKASGDNLPNVAGCRPACEFRMERAFRRDMISDRIKTAPTWLEERTVPMMDRVRQARELLENLKGWPELVPDFQHMLENHPILKRFFGL